MNSTNKELPPDPEGMNDDRARWADQAIKYFIGITGTEKEDGLADLLCNLMHWADRNGLSFEAEFGRALKHYNHETSE